MSNTLTSDPRDLILNVRDLPSIPGVITHTLRVVNDSASSSVDVELIIMRDQSLTAKILRVVNSAAYGFSRRIGSVREAVTMLGMRKIKAIVGSMVAANLFKRGMPGLVAPERLWTHSLSASIWAREIITHKKIWGVDSAIVAALLHDIGILALCEFAADRYRPVLERCQADGSDLLAVEQSELGVTHAHIGGQLCSKWKLPVSTTMLVGHHHTSLCPSDPSLSVVMLADHLASICGEMPFDWGTVHQLPDGLLASLGISSDDLAILRRQESAIHYQTAALREVAESEE